MTALEFALVGFVVVTAVLTAAFRDLVGAVATFAAFSLGIAVVWLLLAAPDVALTEAAVGAGVMTMLLLVALMKTSRSAFENDEVSEPFRPLDIPAAIVVTAVAIPLAYSVSFFPAVGDPNAPAVTPTDPVGDPTPYGYYVGPELADIGIDNAVAAVLVVYRNLDTFGEVIVAFAAVIGVLVVLDREQITEPTRNRAGDRNRDTRDRDSDGGDRIVAFPDPYVMSPVVKTAVRLVVPFVFSFGVYLTLHGTALPAGGFQGGVVMGSAFVLVGLAFGLGPTTDWIDERSLVTAMALGAGTFVIMAFGAVVVGGVPFEFRAYTTSTLLAVEVVELGIGLLVGGIVTALVVVTAAGVMEAPTRCGDAGEVRTTEPDRPADADESGEGDRP